MVVKYTIQNFLINLNITNKAFKLNFAHLSCFLQLIFITTYCILLLSKYSNYEVIRIKTFMITSYEDKKYTYYIYRVYPLIVKININVSDLIENFINYRYHLTKLNVRI